MKKKEKRGEGGGGFRKAVEDIIGDFRFNCFV
jgi:hypothetical protein